MWEQEGKKGVHAGKIMYVIIETAVHLLAKKKSGKSLKAFIQWQEMIRYEFHVGVRRQAEPT